MQGVNILEMYYFKNTFLCFIFKLVHQVVNNLDFIYFLVWKEENFFFFLQEEKKRMWKSEKEWNQLFKMEISSEETIQNEPFILEVKTFFHLQFFFFF